MSDDRVIDTLHAEDLWSKFGFGDGSPFKETKATYEEVEDALDGVESGDVLTILVLRYLVPEIRRVTGTAPETRVVHGHHNQIRAVGYDRETMPAPWSDISVDITLEDLRSASAEVRMQRPIG